jgi:TonB-linked SusC/RagA family outer membrane protein
MKDMIILFKKRFLSAKLMLICMLMFFGAQVETQAADRSKVVNFAKQTITLKEVFAQVEKQTGLITVFSNNELDMAKVVKLPAAQFKLDDLYSLILKNTNLEYEISDKYVVIRIHKSSVEKAAELKRRITGVVLDDQKYPLMGATIIVKGTSGGTIADFNGNFELNLPAKSGIVLEASFVGMSPKQILLKPDQTQVSFILTPVATAIDEVTIVGAYGTKQKRSDLVSSVFQVDEKQLKTLPAARIDNVLDGLMPGLQVMVNSDDASSTKTRYKMRVRGEGSLSASNEPLWVVDGTPIYTGNNTNLVPGISTSVSPLSYINPDDIESITLLKDAAAASIYGANGSNGVLLVTTKSGKNAKPTISLSQQNGFSYVNPSTKFKVLNAEQYMTLAKEAYLNAGKDMKYFPFQDNDLNAYSTTATDWSDVYYDYGFVNQTNLSVRGGAENVNYFISGGYYMNQSTVIGNKQERFSTRAKVNLKLTKKLNVTLNTTGSYNVNNVFIPGNDYYEILPIYSPYNLDGTYRLYNQSVKGKNETTGDLDWTTTKFFNSVAEREQNDNYQHTVMVNNNLTVEYNILKGLNFTSQLGVDYQSTNEFLYSARSNWSGISSTGEKTGYATKNNASFMTLTGIQRLNFERTFGKSNISTVMGMEASSQNTNTLSAKGYGFVNDKVKEVSYAANKDASGSRYTTRALSYFMQATYGYDNRYFLNVNGRRDGNSGFGSGEQWDNYGSVGGSWNFHNEKFYPFSFIKIFKLKATFGTNGNSRVGTREALGLYSYTESNNYMGTVGSSLSGNPNPTLTWESARMANLGLRLKFGKRVDVDLDLYQKRTIRLINQLDVSRATGDTRVYRNSGETLNRGIEANIEVLVVDKKDLEWTLTVNAAHNKNKLVDLYNGIQTVMGNYLWREGYDVKTLYLIRWAGVDPRDGAPLWYDANGNVTRTYSIDNRVAWKSAAPKLTGGIINSVRYRNFTLSSQMSYVLGGYAFSTFGRNVSSDGYEIMSQNQSVNQLDRWQKPGDIATTPKLIWGYSTKSVMNSTRYVYKSTYLKLKNVALSYRVPDSFSKKLGIASCALSVIGDNLAIWTPYDKPDRNSYKQSMSGYPMETTFSMGVNITF